MYILYGLYYIITTFYPHIRQKWSLELKSQHAEISLWTKFRVVWTKFRVVWTLRARVTAS